MSIFDRITIKVNLIAFSKGAVRVYKWIRRKIHAGNIGDI